MELESRRVTSPALLNMRGEPWFLTEEGALFGIQDTYVVTDKGCIKIGGLDRNIIQVYYPFC